MRPQPSITLQPNRRTAQELRGNSGYKAAGRCRLIAGSVDIAAVGLAIRVGSRGWGVPTLRRFFVFDPHGSGGRLRNPAAVGRKDRADPVGPVPADPGGDTPSTRGGPLIPRGQGTEVDRCPGRRVLWLRRRERAGSGSRGWLSSKVTDEGLDVEERRFEVGARFVSRSGFDVRPSCGDSAGREGSPLSSRVPSPGFAPEPGVNQSGSHQEEQGARGLRHRCRDPDRRGLHRQRQHCAVRALDVIEGIEHEP